MDRSALVLSSITDPGCSKQPQRIALIADEENERPLADGSALINFVLHLPWVLELVALIESTVIRAGADDLARQLGLGFATAA